MKYQKLGFIFVASTLAASVSLTAVTIDSIFTSTYVPGTYVIDSQVDNAVTSFTIPLSDLTTAGFSASGNDKLVLSISTKWASNPGGAVTALSYDGNALTQAVAQTGQRTRGEIWYLDNVGSDGDISFTFDAVTEGFAIRLFALDGAAAGVTSTGNKAQTSDGVLPTLSASSSAFVLWEASIHRGTTNIDNDYNDSSFTWGGRGGSSAFWDIEAAGGTFDANVINTRTDGSFVGASFAAVPEPSAALLIGGLGLLMLLRRRR
ncbi:MAG: PEP-CTERM sorting domain-containing protein [Opitutales bacterium]